MLLAPWSRSYSSFGWVPSEASRTHPPSGRSQQIEPNGKNNLGGSDFLREREERKKELKNSLHHCKELYQQKLELLYDFLKIGIGESKGSETLIHTKAGNYVF